MTLRRAGVYWGRKKNVAEVDLYANASIVLSNKKLVQSYSGPCWKVRRISDNTLHDVGFDSSGWISESDLVSILGVGIGRLNKWFDQKANNNATAPSTATEPLIWNNGFITGLNALPAIDFEGTNVRTLYFDSDIEYCTDNGIFQLNVIDTPFGNAEQILSHSANRQWRLANTGNLQTTGIFGFVNALSIGTDRNIVGFRAYDVAGNYNSQIFDEFTDSALVDQSATSTWTLNRIGVRSASSEPFRGLIHENIFFNDYSLCPETDIINEKISLYK